MLLPLKVSAIHAAVGYAAIIHTAIVCGTIIHTAIVCGAFIHAAVIRILCLSCCCHPRSCLSRDSDDVTVLALFNGSKLRHSALLRCFWRCPFPPQHRSHATLCLQGLRQSEGRNCVWLFHDAAHTLFEMARRRVYIYRAGGVGGTTAAAANGANSAWRCECVSYFTSTK